MGRNLRKRKANPVKVTAVACKGARPVDTYHLRKRISTLEERLERSKTRTRVAVKNLELACSMISKNDLSNLRQKNKRPVYLDIDDTSFFPILSLVLHRGGLLSISSYFTAADVRSLLWVSRSVGYQTGRYLAEFIAVQHDYSMFMSVITTGANHYYARMIHSSLFKTVLPSLRESWAVFERMPRRLLNRCDATATNPIEKYLFETRACFWLSTDDARNAFLFGQQYVDKTIVQEEVKMLHYVKTGGQVVFLQVGEKVSFNAFKRHMKAASRFMYLRMHTRWSSHFIHRVCVTAKKVGNLDEMFSVVGGFLSPFS